MAKQRNNYEKIITAAMSDQGLFYSIINKQRTTTNSNAELRVVDGRELDNPEATPVNKVLVEWSMNKLVSLKTLSPEQYLITLNNPQWS